MSKNLIYANADEFHVKSTIVYATGVGDSDLYYDEESTKPVYADELKRLFFAGGLKISYQLVGSGLDETDTTTLTVFLSPVAFSEVNGHASIMCFVNAGNMREFGAPARSTHSEHDLFPHEPVQDETVGEHA